MRDRLCLFDKGRKAIRVADRVIVAKPRQG